MGKALKDTIRDIAKDHLENHNGLVLGQCLTAVGWVAGTVPDTKGLIELPLSEVAGTGIAVGTAIAQRRPIYVIRYQDFAMLCSSPLINVAAKGKWFNDIPMPMWIRLIANEGNGFGLTHSARLHSIFMHFPGFKVCAPITSEEYQNCWNQFMLDDVPYIVSEHRLSYNNTEEVDDIEVPMADITIFAISIARFNAVKAIEMLKQYGIKANLYNVIWLKPNYTTQSKYLSPHALVIDTGFLTCGAAESLAYNLSVKFGKVVHAMGLEDESCPAMPKEGNLTPSAEMIVRKVREICGKN